MRRKGEEKMNRIYLCGKEADTGLTFRLKKVLERYGTVRYRGICSGSGQKDFFLEEGENWPASRQERGLLLLKDSFGCGKGAPPQKGWTAVLRSDHAEAVQALRGTGIPAVTCGSAQRDSLSLSSWDFPQGSVSLLRGVTALTGETLEPGEIPVVMDGPCPREWMPLLCAALLLCGVPCSRGYRL